MIKNNTLSRESMASLSSLLILLTITLMLFTEGSHERRAIPSKEEYKEMERQLKAINKPALMSFKTKDGDIFDCIEIHKQLAFDHHLLKNHSVQLKPTTVPEGITSNNISDRHDPFPFLEKGIKCPDGTVIIKRTTMEYLMEAKRLKSMGFNGPRHFLTERNETNLEREMVHWSAEAHYTDYRLFNGVKGNINFWEPKVYDNQASLALISVAGGSKETFAAISVGWMVNPSLYKSNRGRLYASWQRDHNICYDMTCPGFVQVSKTIPLGVILQPASIYNGAQHEVRLSLFHDRTTRDWWVVYGNENIGYWPGLLFSNFGLMNGALHATWGGQVYSHETERIPVMGSGHWPNEGYRRAAYVYGMKIIDGSGNVLDPDVNMMRIHLDNEPCYKAKFTHQYPDPWSRTVFYGGPGGCSP